MSSTDLPTTIEGTASSSSQPQSHLLPPSDTGPALGSALNFYVNSSNLINASARTSMTRVNDDFAGSDFLASPPPIPPLPLSDAIATAASSSSPLSQSSSPQADNNHASHHEEVPPTAKTSLTFLLISGRRRTMTFEPETTVGRVKELVWNAWNSDWQDPDARPPTPSHIRILYLGKILQDDDTLTHLNFPTHQSTSPPPSGTIVHLSIRPYAPPTEEINKSGGGGSRLGRRSNGGGEDADAGSCCCVIC